MTLLETFILVSYFAILFILVLFGIHRYYIVYLYRKHREEDPQPSGKLNPLPRVTIQLPLYNEMYVVQRLIEAVAKIRYPKELLEIQVLDDSTDETQTIASSAVERMKEAGFDIAYLHRDNREGFKAGALREGLSLAKGEFIAIFDADFIPDPDILEKAINYFSDEKVAMVQSRWGHVNRDYSLLTQVQAILLDGHFIIEHTARSRSGRFFNFNGTAGIWRKKAIEDAGGWELDTLTEDLDLSYRAQLKGWKFIYLPGLVSPAEVPVEMNSFKTQQHRWAKGSIQTGKKLIPRILRSSWPWRVKVESVVHLMANLAYVLMVLLSILMFPAMVIRYNIGWYQLVILDLPVFMIATFSVILFYFSSQCELDTKWWVKLKYVPFLMCVGIGLCVNNARAVLEAILDYRTGFTRTPKYRIESKKDGWRDKKYAGIRDLSPYLELILGIYFSFTIYYAIQNEIYGTIPFLILFQVGFLYTSLMSFFQATGKELLFSLLERTKYSHPYT